MTINAGAYSTRGLIREHNEDAFLLGAEKGGGALEDSPASFRGDVQECPVIAVADGMGGHEAGDRASRFIVERLSLMFQEKASIDSALLEAALTGIHGELLEEGKKQHTPNMGSTLTGLVLYPAGGFFNIGDSRVYRLRSGFLQQISRDDSLSRLIPGAAKNIITNAMGAGLSEITVDSRFSQSMAVAGDIFFLCSDGVHGFVNDEDLEAILRSQFSPLEKARAIVEKALENKSDDNCTALVAELEA